MNKVSLSFLSLLACLYFSSCYDESNSFGKNLVSSAFRNISVDSCTVTVTNTVIDSLETTGQGLSLVGQYTHPLWGTVATCAYLPYNAPTYSTDANEVVKLDSLVLSLTYGGYFVGDTTQLMRFTIHRLTEKIQLNDNGYLYNNSSFGYDPEPIASYTFKPKPGSGERLEIRLPDALGKDMLERLHRGDDALSTDRFENYMKGLVVVPDGSVCRSVVSFSASDTASAMILRYHVQDDVEQAVECMIYPNTDKQFYHVDHDRTGTLMQGLPAKKIEAASAILGNRGVLFGGLGWYSRLSFPHLNNILQQGERVAIESAYLKIYPEPQTYSDYNSLPDSLYLYIIDENNVVTDAVTDYLGSEVQAGTLVKDDTYPDNTFYYFDISSFMQDELGTFGMYKHSLQLVFNESDYSQTLRNLTFSDQQGRSPIVLQLIYKVYESY